jgi:3',5'-cyclic AMP phosphodiesterase CpdA
MNPNKRVQGASDVSRNSFPRRAFLRATAAVGLAAWSLRARAELAPALVRLGFIAGPPTPTGLPAAFMDNGPLAEHTDEIIADLMDQLSACSPPPAAILQPSRSPLPERADRLLIIGTDRLYSDPATRVGDDIQSRLRANPQDPAIIVATPSTQWPAPASSPGHLVPPAIELWLQANPQVVLVLTEKVLANQAAYIGAGTLALATASPLLYPCGGRLIDVEVKPGGEVTITSRFVQTRLLDLVEESYVPGKGKIKYNIGRREDRSLIAAAGKITKTVAPLDPNLAPWWEGQDRVNLGLLTDTHLSLDQFVTPEAAKNNRLIGHFNEAGSIAIIEDVVDQLGSGRHRVEFFDAAFNRDAAAAGNYLELPLDALILTGDNFEHGRRAEAEAFLALIKRLPAALRARTMLTPGNHDLHHDDFAPNGVASNRSLFTELCADYLPAKTETSYVVHLNDWLSVIMLDTVIPHDSGLGLIQDRIDWLEDMLDQMRSRVVLTASHHPIYPISLVPPVMEAYLQSSSNFTPKHAAARDQLIALLARANNLKMAISGHYHGVVVDRFKKDAPSGAAPDDGYTTHLQVPCTAEYPCGYRLLQISRAGGRATIEYLTAYTRRADLRDESRHAPIFKILGTEARVPHKYQGSLEQLKGEDHILGQAARLDPYDLLDLNVRGFKDGTARMGRGKGGKPNINGRIEISITPG